ANVGIELCAGNARIVYIPGAAAVTPTMLARMEVADIVFFDGTLFRDDEMITTGTGAKTGRDHLVVAKEGAVEEDDIGDFHPCQHRRRHRGGAGDIDDARVACAKLDADIC